MNEEEARNLVAQFQNTQQQLQALLIQKESMKVQSMEIDRALEELTKSDQKSAYKISGQIMISKSLEELTKELQETKENVEIKIKSMEKTEERVTNKLKELQSKLKEVMK